MPTRALSRLTQFFHPARRSGKQTSTGFGTRFRLRIETLDDRSAPSSVLELTDPLDLASAGLPATTASETWLFVDPAAPAPAGPAETGPQEQGPQDAGVPDNTAYTNAATGSATGTETGGTVKPDGTKPTNTTVPPNATVIGGPGRITYPDGSIGIVTDRTVAGDADAIRRVAPPGTPVTDGVPDWNRARQIICGPAAGSVGGLIISGHGSGAGVQSSGGGLTPATLDQATVDAIISRLAPGAPIIIVGCGCGGNGNGAQEIADRTGHPVIANTGSMSDGNHGDGNWVRYDPFVGPPAPPAPPPGGP